MASSAAMPLLSDAAGVGGAWDGNMEGEMMGICLLLSFFASSAIAVLALAIRYLFFHNHERTAPGRLGNPIDVLVVRAFRGALAWCTAWLADTLKRLVRRSTAEPPPPPPTRAPIPAAHDGLNSALDQAVLALSNAQLATAATVLVYGTAALFHGVSARDWYLAVGLCWLAVVSNLASTAYLGNRYLAFRPGPRRVQFGLVAGLLLATAAATYPLPVMKTVLAGAPDDITGRQILLSTPALEFFILSSRSAAGMDVASVLPAAVPLVLLAALFVVLRFLERPSGRLFAWCDHYDGAMAGPTVGDGLVCRRCEHRWLVFLVRPCLAGWLVLRLYADLAGSVLAQIFFLAALLVWVTARLMDVQGHVAVDDLVAGVWSLGQVGAVVLFVAPLRPLVEYVCRDRSRSGLVERILEPAASAAGAESGPDPPQIVPNWMRKIRRRLSNAPSTLSVDSCETAIFTASEGSVQGDYSHYHYHTPRESYFPELPQTPMTPTGSVDATPEHHASRRTAVEIIDHQPRSPDANTLRHQFYLQSPWFPLALPIALVSHLVHVTLLLTLPWARGQHHHTPAEAATMTVFWWLVYTPLLIFLFVLAAMVVQERSTSPSRAQMLYAGLSAGLVLLSVGSLLDTVFGLGVTPMSTIGLAGMGMGVGVYVLYGCIAGPGARAKGKAKVSAPAPAPAGNRTAVNEAQFGGVLCAEPEDLEAAAGEQAPLLGGAPSRMISSIKPAVPRLTVRIPVPKRRRWYGPERRSSLGPERRSSLRKVTTYGTVGSSYEDKALDRSVAEAEAALVAAAKVMATATAGRPKARGSLLAA